MHPDFMRAIVKGEDIETVRDRLFFNIDEASRRRKEQIRKDYEAACLILDGWKRPEDSVAHRYAAAVLEDAEDAEKHKTEQTRQMEEIRQQVEEAWLKSRRANENYPHTERRLERA